VPFIKVVALPGFSFFLICSKQTKCSCN